MVVRYQVLCINKKDRSNCYEHITHLGGVNADGSRWKFDREEVIRRIDSKNFEFYVNRAGKETRVEVITPITLLNNRYLKTVNDGISENNLLSLLECPYQGVLAGLINNR